VSRADDAHELTVLLSQLSTRAAKARAMLGRVPEGGHDGREAWLDGLEEVRGVLDVATGVRVKFQVWSDEANNDSNKETV
jgi:hypothetical protein